MALDEHAPELVREPPLQFAAISGSPSALPVAAAPQRHSVPMV